MKLQDNVAEKPFYLVWCEETGYTRYRHQDFGMAQTEANRLASLNPGKRFFVLLPAGSAIVQKPVKWTSLIDLDQLIPF